MGVMGVGLPVCLNPAYPHVMALWGSEGAECDCEGNMLYAARLTKRKYAFDVSEQGCQLSIEPVVENRPHRLNK